MAMPSMKIRQVVREEDTKDEKVPERTSSLSQPASSRSAHSVDLVLSFSSALADKSEASQLTKDYEGLLKALREQGLQAAGRAGAKGSNELLVFIRCPETRLRELVEAERRSDWLHGVSSTRPDPRTPRDFVDDPLTPADRLRLIHDLIVSPNNGAGVTPQKGQYSRVKAIFPPHDNDFNKRWLRDWTSANHAFSIPQKELDRIKDVHGESVALYFEFLRYYLAALVIPATIGVITHFASKTDFSVPYALLLSIWSVVFVEAWRLRERGLAVRWGVRGCHNVGRRRADFKADHTVEDPATGEKVPQYTWWRRDARVVGNIPVLFAFAALLGLLITTIFTIETIINEVYDGPGKQYLSLVPTILFSGIVPQVIALWHQTATRLTRWENHAFEDDYSSALTLKVFALNCMVSYGALFLCAYVYIPFGTLAMPHILNFVGRRAHIKVHSSKLASSKYGINSARLRNTLVALSTTSQVVGAVTELIVPLVLRKVTAEVQQRSAKKSDSPDPKDDDQEASFLKLIRHESTLPEFTLFTEFAEMTAQAGFVMLWSVIWPFVPLCALVNNFFELRGDAFKLCYNVRRPVPARAETIGPWLEALGAMTWLGAITSSSLIYMYKPRPGFESGSVVRETLAGAANALNITTSALQPQSGFVTSRLNEATSHETWSPIKSTLFTAALIGLASEQGYLMARSAIRYVLKRALWNQSTPATTLAKHEGHLKRQYMEALGIPQHDAVEKRSATEEDGSASPLFAKDQGLDELRRIAKTD